MYQVNTEFIRMKVGLREFNTKFPLIWTIDDKFWDFTTYALNLRAITISRSNMKSADSVTIVSGILFSCIHLSLIHVHAKNKSKSLCAALKFSEKWWQTSVHFLSYGIVQTCSLSCCQLHKFTVNCVRTRHIYFAGTSFTIHMHNKNHPQ